MEPAAAPLSVGRLDVEHQGNVHGGELTHRGAIAEAAGGMHPVELAGQRDDVLARGDVLAPHDPEQRAQAAALDFRAAGHLRVLLGHVLVDALAVEHVEREPGDLAVRVEAER